MEEGRQFKFKDIPFGEVLSLVLIFFLIITYPVFAGSLNDEDFHPIIAEAAERYDVEPAMIKAIIMAESGYNPKAVSHKGAVGLMQLMPNTAKHLGIEDAYDPKNNIHGGVKYFKQLLDSYNGDIELALAAYHAGNKKVEKYQGVPPYKSTKHYIRKVLRYYKIYKHQGAEEDGRV